jgi:transcriptional regulator with XRE-family HTH domain
MAKSVAEWCAAKSIAVEKLVEESGVDETRVQAIVLGRWTPSPTERQRISAALGVTVDDIAWGHVTPIQHLYGHGPG